MTTKAELLEEAEAAGIAGASSMTKAELVEALAEPEPEPTPAPKPAPKPEPVKADVQTPGAGVSPTPDEPTRPLGMRHRR